MDDEQQINTMVYKINHEYTNYHHFLEVSTDIEICNLSTMLKLTLTYATQISIT